MRYRFPLTMSDSYQKGFSWPMVLMGLVSLIVLAMILSPWFLKARQQGLLTEAGSNTKAIAGSLSIFRHEYGSYPCDATREILAAKGLTILPPGKSANAYLAQLIVADIADSETYFYAAGTENVHKGDDIKNTPGTILEEGENGFLYIMAPDEKALRGDLSITPLIMASPEKRGRYPRFNTKIYGGKYVYGAVDGSSKQGELSEDGTALSKERAHLFDLGKNSLFGDDIPVFTYPLGL